MTEYVGQLPYDDVREAALDAAFAKLLGPERQPREWQRDAALEGLRRRDVFVRAATGSGKTAVFQALALAAYELYGKYVVVVSPLVLLLQDQVVNLNARVPDAAAMAVPSALEKEHVRDGSAFNRSSTSRVNPPLSKAPSLRTSSKRSPLFRSVATWPDPCA